MARAAAILAVSLIVAPRPDPPHRHHRIPLDGPVVASWYYDAGQTACGFHAFYGIASRTLPCGTRVILQHAGRRIVATVDDRGPYVWSRLFDLNVATRTALACSDLCLVMDAVL